MVKNKKILNKGIIVFVLFSITIPLIITLLFASCEDEIDPVAEMVAQYFATVKSIKPYNTATYNDIFKKYIDYPAWSHNFSDGTHYVNVSGTLKGLNEKIYIKIGVKDDEENKNYVNIVSISITLSDEKLSDSDSKEFEFYMFDAYENGYDSLSDYFNE